MKAWRVILAALVIFAAGAVTGGLVVRFKPPQQPHQSRGSQWSPGPRQRGDFLERMEGELQLTETQRRNIELILSESQEQSKQLWESIAPQAGEIYRRSRQRIREELTPEQATTFEKHFTKPRGSGKNSDSKQGENRGRSKNKEKQC